MYLWDSNILRHFAEGHPTLRAHLERVEWTQIALPSVVVAEVLRGRCEFALKALPDQAPLAHQRLLDTMALLHTFNIVPFDQACVRALLEIQQRVGIHKRYADAMIAATVVAKRQVLVTRNLKHFEDLLAPAQVVNWIDVGPR